MVTVIDASVYIVIFAISLVNVPSYDELVIHVMDKMETEETIQYMRDNKELIEEKIRVIMNKKRGT